MFIPTSMLIILIVMAVPTVFVILWIFNDEMTRRGRCAFGNVDDFREDHSYTIYTHFLYVRIWRESGYHSTALLD